MAKIGHYAKAIAFQKITPLDQKVKFNIDKSMRKTDLEPH